MNVTHVASKSSQSSSPCLTPPLETASSTLGTSFKPLRLSSHPWVRAHLRPTLIGGQKPRLSFLALHYHMHGRESFSEPQSEAIISTPELLDRRYGPEPLSEALNSPSMSAGCFVDARSGSLSTRASTSSACFPSRSNDTPSSPTQGHPLHPVFERRSHSDVLSSHPRPDTSRSASAPEVAAPPPVTSSCPAPDRLTHRPSRKRQRRKKHPSSPPLAAFSTAFADVLTTSDSLFGCPELQLTNSQRLERKNSQRKAVVKWIRDSERKNQDATEHDVTD